MTPSVSTTTGGIRIGTVLDRYEIVRHVARGGMGSIWLGRFGGKHGFSKHVAIKTIAPEYAENPQFHAMFLEEARISSKLVHANVAQVLDVGEHNGGVYIVFEWVDGQPLGQICTTCEASGGRIPLPVLLRVLGDACAGLHAVHELADEKGRPLGVVHRDVTPGNVLVSEAGFAKVIDLGIAKSRDRVHIQTRAGYVKGTPEYMSPEQASREAVDRRADIWSLGAVLFRGLAGAPPFRDRDALIAYIDGKAKLPPLPDDVPLDVRAIVTRALEVAPGDRFATADEMRAALERALHAGETPSADLAQLTSRLVATARDAAVGEQDPTELAASIPAPVPTIAQPAPLASEVRTEPQVSPSQPPRVVVVPVKTLASAGHVREVTAETGARVVIRPAPEVVEPAESSGKRRWVLVLVGVAIAVGAAVALRFWGAP
jgi:serine/threonine protein kinase